MARCHKPVASCVVVDAHVNIPNRWFITLGVLIVSYHYFQVHKQRGLFSLCWVDGLDRLQWLVSANSEIGKNWQSRKRSPAWETEMPASSINWSIEKAPILIRSWSSAVALLAEMVYDVLNFSILRLLDEAAEFGDIPLTPWLVDLLCGITNNDSDDVANNQTALFLITR